MYRVFAPFDDLLFDRLFQPLTGLLSSRLGLARRLAAQSCLDAATAAWILARAQGISQAIAPWDGPAIGLRLCVLSLGLGGLLVLRMLFGRSHVRRVNPLRLSMLPHRAIILVLIAARAVRPADTAIAEVGDLGMLACTWAALYFGACGEPPPQRRASPTLSGARAQA